MVGRLLTYGGGILLSLALLVGVLYVAGVIGIPDAGLEDNSWGEVTEEHIGVVTAVWIDNPNPGISTDRIAVDYLLAMNDVRLAEGNHEGLEVPAGNATTEVETDILHQQITEWWVTHIEADEVSDLAIAANVSADLGPASPSPTVTHEDTVETELERMIAESLGEMEGEHELSPVSVSDGVVEEVVEPTVVVEDTDAAWGTVTRNRTEVFLTFEVHNPNAYPLPTPALTGDMVFNGVGVADWQANEVELLDSAYDTTIPPRSTREITFVANLDNDNVTRWFATHVDNEERSDVNVTAQLALDVNGQTRTIPQEEDAVGCSYDVRTNILVDQESALERQDCSLLILTPPDAATLQELGATVDLTGTDWWPTEPTDGTDGTDGTGGTDDTGGEETDGGTDDEEDDPLEDPLDDRI